MKIESIEAFDEKIVGRILKGMSRFGKYRIMVLPDHPTPISIRTHTADPVPYVIYSNEANVMKGHAETFDENSARQSGIFIDKGFELIERLLNPPCSY